jgi:hypothetical protein
VNSVVAWSCLPEWTCGNKKYHGSFKARLALELSAELSAVTRDCWRKQVPPVCDGVLSDFRPVLYVEFWSRRMQLRQYKMMKLNEVYHLIIYCLNCIRRDRNSTYKTGLQADFQSSHEAPRISLRVLASN